MTTPNETLIRERAYSIWLKEGCPDGAEGRHWDQAKNELERLMPDDRDDGPSQDHHAEGTDESDHATLVAGPEARSDKD